VLSICFVSQEYPEETGWGGIGTYTYEMAHGLARSGHRVTVLSRAINQSHHYIEADGVEVHRVCPSLGLNSWPFLWRFNRWWEGYRLAVAIKLKQLMQERQFDVIETPDLHAEPLLHSFLHRRPPLVVRLHSGSSVVRKFEPANGNGNGSQRDERFERWLIRKATQVTSPSQALLSFVVKGSAPAHCTVIPNPVDVDYFKPDPGVKDSDLPNILFVGRPRFLKGIHVLAEAMPLIWKRIPEATLTLVPVPMGKSGGSPRDAYATIFGNLINDSRVRVLDPISRTGLPEVYRSATVCVVPSLWEGFGYVAAEAMACGKAVVASRIGGLAEIVENGNSGVLVDPGKPVDLSEAIISLLNDPRRRAEISKSARRRIVSQFSNNIVVRQMANLYEQITCNVN